MMVCSFSQILNLRNIFWGTGVWTQGLHLESLHKPFFVMGFFLR
jgi:hypothetical protein